MSPLHPHKKGQGRVPLLTPYLITCSHELCNLRATGTFIMSLFTVALMTLHSSEILPMAPADVSPVMCSTLKMKATVSSDTASLFAFVSVMMPLIHHLRAFYENSKTQYLRES